MYKNSIQMNAFEVDSYKGLNIADHLQGMAKECYLFAWKWMEMAWGNNVEFQRLSEQILLCSETVDYLYGETPKSVKYIRGALRFHGEIHRVVGACLRQPDDVARARNDLPLALRVGDMPGADVKHIVDQALLLGELAEGCLVSEYSHIDQVYFHFHQLIQILYSFAQAYPPKKSKSQLTVAFFLFTAFSADLSH